MENTELAKSWNRLNNYDKLEVISQGIDFANTDDGFLQLRMFRDGSFQVSLQKKLDNHLSVEALSQTTLYNLFSEDYDLEEEDAQTILDWMNSNI